MSDYENGCNFNKNYYVTPIENPQSNASIFPKHGKDRDKSLLSCCTHAHWINII